MFLRIPVDSYSSLGETSQPLGMVPVNRDGGDLKVEVIKSMQINFPVAILLFSAFVSVGSDGFPC